MKRVVKDFILFFVFGALYFGLECLWKGHLTHWSMFVLSGLIGVLIGGINEDTKWEVPFPNQCFKGMIYATIGEACAGIILNVILHLNIWHYTQLAFFWGQCSLIFCFFWFLLSGLCILLDDFLRWKLFGEEKPHYTWG